MQIDNITDTSRTNLAENSGLIEDNEAQSEQWRQKDLLFENLIKEINECGSNSLKQRDAIPLEQLDKRNQVMLKYRNTVLSTVLNSGDLEPEENVALLQTLTKKVLGHISCTDVTWDATDITECSDSAEISGYYDEENEFNVQDKHQKTFIEEFHNQTCQLDDSRITLSGKFSPDAICKNLVDKSVALLSLVTNYNQQMKQKKADLTSKIEQTELKFQDLKTSSVLSSVENFFDKEVQKYDLSCMITSRIRKLTDQAKVQAQRHFLDTMVKTGVEYKQQKDVLREQITEVDRAVLSLLKFMRQNLVESEPEKSALPVHDKFSRPQASTTMTNESVINPTAENPVVLSESHFKRKYIYNPTNAFALTKDSTPFSIPSLDSLVGKTPTEVDQIKVEQIQFFGGKSEGSEDDSCVIAAVRVKICNQQQSQVFGTEEWNGTWQSCNFNEKENPLSSINVQSSDEYLCKIQFIDAHGSFLAEIDGYSDFNDAVWVEHEIEPEEVVVGVFGEVYDTYEGKRLKSLGLLLLNCETLLFADTRQKAAQSFFMQTGANESILAGSFLENFNTSAYQTNK